MSDPLLETVRRHWGYDTLRPIQREAMEAMLAGRDSLIVLPTGGGKSLCYQAPALLRDGLTVVVSPLIALMKDQVDALRACGVAAEQINSGQDPDEKRRIARTLRDGTTRLLFVSPERLAVARFRDFLETLNIAAFAIDEAHCISHWGHDFRPEYRGLSRLHELFPSSSVHAFTATATARVRADIAQQLALVNPVIKVGNFDRPNLTYRVVQRTKLIDQIEQVLESHRGEAGIIYALRRRDVDSLAATLNERGHRVVGYHAGMSSDERRAAQEEFASERCDVVVATVAFGMGIDRSNVRFVLHTGMPKSVEHYQQEAGRAGRDGLAAECILLYSGADAQFWRTLLERSDEEPDPGFIASSLRHIADMQRYATAPVCRHRLLVEYFGEQWTKTNCGACDVCLDPKPVLDDSEVIAQKILSCIIRVREAFGALHVIDVLLGHRTEKVVERRHHELTTFGLMRDANKDEVRNYIDQLIAAGCIGLSGVQYPTLFVTERGRAVLKGDVEVSLVAMRPRRFRATPQKLPSKGAVLSDAGEALFQKLRVWRREKAAERGVPPFVIFDDKTLREIAAHRPRSRRELRAIHGVGDVKLDAFAAEVLSVVEAES